MNSIQTLLTTEPVQPTATIPAELLDTSVRTDIVVKRPDIEQADFKLFIVFT